MALSLVYKCPIWINTEIIETAGIDVSDADVQKETDSEGIEDEDDFEIESIVDMDTGEDIYSNKSKKRTVSIEDLEHMMDNAITNEEYEIAATLRDRILDLKRDI